MLAAVLVLVGGVLVLTGTVIFLVKAFRVSVAWGVGVLLLAPIGIVFLVKNWKESKASFLLQLFGVILMVAGILLGYPLPATP
jgi:uncharacterized membrane protein